ncbi:AAA family ATPase [Pseudomonas putida]|uniref:ATP-dependent nuclease n=1 Tax=Pseudomonas putida TaxID=303 RepID=UPI002ED65731|nr:AAA family ATPase [Pseudomonas putida]
MILENIKIKNFRTLVTDTTIGFTNGITIVGPNSSGKTNILKAVEMLFTGFDNKNNYSPARDFPANVDNGQSSLTATFTLETKDEVAQEYYRLLNSCLDQPKQLTDKVTVYLTFTKAGNPSYRLFVGEKYNEDMKGQFNSYQKTFLEILFAAFECHYVSSSKNIDDLYNELLLPYMRRSVSSRLSDIVTEIDYGLSEISGVIDSQLNSVGMGNIKTHFCIPNNSVENLLGGFEFHLSDPVVTEIHRKGMGIQSASMLASFVWIAQQEKKLSKTPIWLIEEPESYLHPELAESCFQILRNLSEISHVVVTTHSLGFVPKDPKCVIRTEIEEGTTKISACTTYVEATKAIRDSLGVKFSDFCNLGLLNIFVEGKSDREVFKWALSRISIKATGKHGWDNVRRAEFLDFGGVGALEGFIKASWEYIHRERPAVCVLDGDDAGDKTRRNLQGFCSQKKLPFEHNKHFIILPTGFALEGLFPREWIIQAHKEHSGWFKSFSCDLEDNLLPFECASDDAKEKLRNHLIQRAESTTDESWIVRFEKLFNALDEALEIQVRKIYSTHTKVRIAKNLAVQDPAG